MSDTFDRSQLDGKDREQLSEIASALGVKSISRMRKAELVDAIVGATQGANGDSAPKTKKVRSSRIAGADDFASIADEENALAGGEAPADDMALIRPRRRTAPDANGASTAPPPAPATGPMRASQRTAPSRSSSS
jgi:transcription termination factor Rho